MASFHLAPVATFLLLSACMSYPPALPNLLERSAWTIESFHDGNRLVASSDVFPNPGWITFNDDQIGGTPGCGALIGYYRISTMTISIHAGTFLTGSCLGNRGGRGINLLDDSGRVTKALSRTHTIASHGSELILQADNGETVATLSPRR